MSTITSSGEKEAAHSSDVVPAHVTAPTLDDEQVIVGWRTWLAIFAACCCPFCGYWSAFFYTVPTDILGAGAKGVWLPTAFSLLNAALGAPVSHASEIFGRRPIIIGGFVVALVGAILVASAKTFTPVIIGSAFMSGVLSNQGGFFSIPSEVLPRRMRGVAQCLMIATGDLTAGLIFLACCSLFFLYHPKPVIHPDGTTPWQRLVCEIDWVGSFLQCCSCIPFMTALTWGGSAYAWSSPHVLGTIIVGVLFFVVLALHQTFWQKHGVLDHDLFVSRNFALASIGCFIEGIGFVVFVSFYPLQVANLWDTRSFYQAVRLVPFFVMFGLLAPFFGLYTKRYLEVKLPLIVGWALAIIGAAILATAGTGSASTAIGAIIIAGSGFASPFAILVTTAQLGVPARLLGLATAQTAAIRALGIAPAATEATATALHAPWYFMIALAVVGLGLTFFLDAEFIRNAMTWQVERPLEELRHVHDDKEKV
ncbi:MFS general substrate transporter [Pseudohyphozyma bogoriensis]|nr:MFS general substrate transporter [Pseudohyphozyma bogoriensis]